MWCHQNNRGESGEDDSRMEGSSTISDSCEVSMRVLGFCLLAGVRILTVHRFFHLVGVSSFLDVEGIFRLQMGDGSSSSLSLKSLNGGVNRMTLLSSGERTMAANESSVRVMFFSLTSRRIARSDALLKDSERLCVSGVVLELGEFVSFRLLIANMDAVNPLFDFNCSRSRSSFKMEEIICS